MDIAIGITISVVLYRYTDSGTDSIISTNDDNLLFLHHNDKLLTLIL